MSVTSNAAVSETNAPGLYRIVDGDDPCQHDLFVIDKYGRKPDPVVEKIDAAVRAVKLANPDEYNDADLAAALDEHDLILAVPIPAGEEW